MYLVKVCHVRHVPAIQFSDDVDARNSTRLAHIFVELSIKRKKTILISNDQRADWSEIRFCANWIALIIVRHPTIARQVYIQAGCRPRIASLPISGAGISSSE